MVKKLLLNLIRFYQRQISPCRPPCCRFVPTCSQYALEAVETYGALKGGWLALRRLLRCNPFCRGDIYDPVPVKNAPSSSACTCPACAGTGTIRNSSVIRNLRAPHAELPSPAPIQEEMHESL